MILLILAAAVAPLAIAPPPGPEVPKVTVTAERDAEWHSYRRAYGAAAFFQPYLSTRPLIQAHMQIRPNTPDLPMDGLSVHLSGEKTSIHLTADAIGRITVPMLKQAYDEDAVLRLNRRKGNYHFQGRYSIREREDGMYSAAGLRAACEQLLSAQRESGYRMRLIGKKCAGVKFVYARTGPAAPVVVRDAALPERELPFEEGHAFENATMGVYKIALYRFGDWPAGGTIEARERPIAIGTLYE
ncbi:MAG: hypothetical protein ACXWU9_09955 [Telluria sp.]